MHVIIVNGSPRVEKYSNTDKIIDAFAAGLTESGATFEKYAISNKSNWDEIRKVYLNNKEIVFALPLYVESLPGIFLEFLESLPVKETDTRVSFILQSGFAEACQLDGGKALLKKLPQYLGVSLGGILIKGNNFGIRIVNEEQRQKITAPYKEMGKAFVRDNGFSEEVTTKFAGPKVLPLPVRLLLQFLFKTFARKNYQRVAKEWGCTQALDVRPYGQI